MSQTELFPHELPEVSQRALRSARTPDRVALIRICSQLAPLFFYEQERAGRAAIVDATRLFGCRFGNDVKRTLGEAAGVYCENVIPGDLMPAPAAVIAAEKRHARRLIQSFTKALEKLRAIDEGGA